VTSIDMSETNIAKERIDSVMESLLKQNEDFSRVVNETAERSNEIANTIGGMVTGIQFADRTSQRLTGIVDTLKVLRDANDTQQADTRAAFPEVPTPDPDIGAMNDIIQSLKLGESRQRFIRAALQGETPSDEPDSAEAADGREVPHADSSDDIELF
jgi:methyl-accepting chemotaxis protein